MLLKGFDKGQPLLEELSLVDHFIHLGLVFGVGLVLLGQHLLSLDQLECEELLGFLRQATAPVSVDRPAAESGGGNARAPTASYPDLLVERLAAVLYFGHVPLQQRHRVMAAL